MVLITAHLNAGVILVVTVSVSAGTGLKTADEHEQSRNFDIFCVLLKQKWDWNMCSYTIVIFLLLIFLHLVGKTLVCVSQFGLA